jgi:serine protease inhibitor
LAKTYNAASFQGEMGSDSLNQELQNWLNEQTGGLLKEQASQIELEPETVLALASTIYFQAKWSSEFSESNTENGVFHGPNGDQNCDFMRQSSSGAYYWGEHFSAVPKRLEESGRMWLILPDDGVSAEDLLSDDEVMKLFSSGDEWTNRKDLMIHLSMPKFDVSSDLSLVEGLKTLGIQDVFDPEAADFSPMTEDSDGIYVSQAKHAARVMVDEKGCTAAAYTVMAMAGGAMPPDDEVDFVLDRPFLFVITSEAGAPLFIGLVNQPV